MTPSPRRGSLPVDSIMRAINVGYACNNACLFCAQGELRAVRAVAADGEVARAIEAIASGETVAFTGGEPTLFGDLPGWIRAATARGAASVLVQTNGRRLAYRAYVRELREASGVLRLDVSLQGSTAPMHDWHTGTPGSFAQTVQGLRHARLEGIPVAVSTVVTRSNYRHLAEIVRVAHSASAMAIQFRAVAPLGRASARAFLLVPAPELVAPHLQRALGEATRLGLRSDEAIGELFAGMGDVETPVAAPERVVVRGIP